ncbi:MAG TPA: NAD(P)-dependent oxidoreductase [Blastocatellia bacterium]|nr:NAD(P)-dependent oxidoreductase [Blastocatellia bacterium]
MKIFVAGASGAIGLPLIAELIRRGHTVTGMTTSEAAARRIIEQGAAVEIANAFDAPSVDRALRRAGPEIVIDQLTALPKDPADLHRYLPGDTKLRLDGGGNLHRTALAHEVRRYLQQSSGFFLKPDTGLADESESMAIDASPDVATFARMYAELEARTLSSEQMEGVILRYGFFYGPNTWYHREGAAAQQVRRQQFPIIAGGQGVWSFVHIEDAALATVAALTAEAGVYNVVDDDPSPVSVWLPRFAQWLGAPPPTEITEQVALETAGEDAVYYQTRLRGASNAKARKILNLRPRRLEWLTALRAPA